MIELVKVAKDLPFSVTLAAFVLPSFGQGHAQMPNYVMTMCKLHVVAASCWELRTSLHASTAKRL